MRMLLNDLWQGINQFANSKNKLFYTQINMKFVNLYLESWENTLRKFIKLHQIVRLNSSMTQHCMLLQYYLTVLQGIPSTTVNRQFYIENK